MLNYSFSNLLLSRQISSPFISYSHISSIDIRNSMFQRFFSTLVLTKFTGIRCRSTLFSEFLDTTMRINSLEVFTSTVVFSDSSQPIELDKCQYRNCRSMNYSGAFHFNDGGKNNFNMFITRCSFIGCYSPIAGAFEFRGNNFLISKTCAMMCNSGFMNMFCFVNANGPTDTFNLTVLDHCGGRPLCGLSNSVDISGGDMLFHSNNVTRCIVREKHCCGAFGKGNAFLYRYNQNINCSARVYMGFYIQGIENYFIGDSLFYRCVPYNQYAEALVENDSPVVIQRFKFVQTKMLLLVKSSSIDRRYNVTFLNCQTDVKEEKLVFNNQPLHTVNFTMDKQDIEYELFTTDYAQWDCATNPLPTQRPSPTESPTPSPQRTPCPSATIRPIPVLPSATEYVEVKQPVTKGDITQIVGLVILVGAAGIVFFLNSQKNKKKKKVNVPEENQGLLDAQYSR